jgi:ABC-type amino acid transport substrate-binding protein
MRLFLLTFIVIFSASTQSADAVQEGSQSLNKAEDNHFSNELLIAAPSLSHLIEKDQSGIYQQIFRRATENMPYKITQTYYPYRRALLEFEHKKVDCTYSYTEILEQLLGESAVISSFPLGAFIFHAFTRKSTPPINEFKQLNNLTIGGINGQEHYYLSTLPPDITFDLKLINTDKQGIDMLKLKRLDAYISALPDVNPYLHELSYNKELVLYKSFDRITCHNTPRNRQFIAALSSQLQQLRETGEYKRIAGDFYIDF